MKRYTICVRYNNWSVRTFKVVARSSTTALRKALQASREWERLSVYNTPYCVLITATEAL